MRLVYSQHASRRNTVLGIRLAILPMAQAPGASINLILTARALAFVRGREYVCRRMCSICRSNVIRHRMVLSYEAMSDGVTADAIVQKF